MPATLKRGSAADELQPPLKSEGNTNMPTSNFANLSILQGMDSETVDLVATGPPFNMKNESAAKESWGRARIAASRERDGAA